MDEFMYDDLFGNFESASVLREYDYELSLLREVIEISEEAVSTIEAGNALSYEGICYMFAHAVVNYSKIAYDDMQLGYSDAASMAVRALIENNVFLELIYNDSTKELWKYYLVQSYWNAVTHSGSREMSDHDAELFDKMLVEYSIDERFTKRQGGKKAYIEKTYGWTYKINDNFNFKSISGLVNKDIYNDYKIMSKYSHGTSLGLKLGAFLLPEHIMNIISIIFFNLYCMINTYCWELVDDSYYEISDELESLFEEYVDTINRPESERG